MKPILHSCLAGLAVVTFIATTSLEAATVQSQSFTLNPGWNSIHLEIDPAVRTPGVVFTNLPVASVWSRVEPLSSVAFIQNQNEVRPGDTGWLSWFPTSKPEAVIGNLFSIQANRAYLVKIEGSVPVTLTVSGHPVFRTPAWRADAYNLKGFPVDPAAPPTFQNFFRHSPAHYNTNLNQLRGIYRLNALGVWTVVNLTDAMKGGEACWVFTQGVSDYNGPLAIKIDPGDGIQFGSGVDRLNMSLRNGTASSTLNVTVRDLVNPATTPLLYQRFDATNGFVFDPLPVSLALPTATGESKPLTLAIRRLAFTTPTYESVLEVKDGTGARYLIPVTAQRIATASASLPVLQEFGPHQATTNSNALPYAGLWAGIVTIKSVSEANSGLLTTNPITQQITRAAGSTSPTPVKTEFNFRLIVHVDNSGQARLLKEVVQMFQNGSYTNNAQGQQVVAVPGRYVLLTDDRLISQYQGAALRDGVPVGRRLSTAAIDFNLGPTNHLDLAGTFNATGQLSAGITNAPNDPTNPYKHKYHPDHDNLDLRFANYQAEAYAVTRQISLSFASTDPSGGNAPGFGYSVMGGTYAEVLTGLHKAPVNVQGVFRLERVSEVAVLNQ